MTKRQLGENIVDLRISCLCLVVWSRGNQAKERLVSQIEVAILRIRIRKEQR